MPTLNRRELEERIADTRRKIAELDAFRDDPKINKILRIFQRQVAQDSYHLMKMDECASNLVASPTSFD